MNMVRHDDVTSDEPRRSLRPHLNQEVMAGVVRKPGSPVTRANRVIHDDGLGAVHANAPSWTLSRVHRCIPPNASICPSILPPAPIGSTRGKDVVFNVNPTTFANRRSVMVSHRRMRTFALPGERSPFGALIQTQRLCRRSLAPHREPTSPDSTLPDPTPRHPPCPAKRAGRANVPVRRRIAQTPVPPAALPHYHAAASASTPLSPALKLLAS